MGKNTGGTDSIKRKIAALKMVRSSLPTILANECVNFFKGSFKRQGWLDSGIMPWKPRKKSDPGRAILVKSGDLRKSVFVEAATWKTVRISSNLPYSAIHNEGGMGKAFGKHSFQMPKRKFMGDSKKLRGLLTAKIEGKINKAMKA